MSVAIKPHGNGMGLSPRRLLEECDGFYECPKDENGKRIGPLVAYAGRDHRGRQYVGDEFVNFAKIEQWPYALEWSVAKPLARRVSDLHGHGHFVYCGAPEGGKTLASFVAAKVMGGGRYVYPEKLVVEEATETSRAKTVLKFTGRHEIYPGEGVFVVEDVCNNFSTTAQLIGEILAAGGVVLGIICFLNRSPRVRDMFICEHGEFRVIAHWDEPMMEYEQGDPRVTSDLLKKNVVWKPKDGWARLQSFHQKHDLFD